MSDKRRMEINFGSISIEQDKFMAMVAEHVAQKLLDNFGYWTEEHKQKLLDRVEWNKLAPHLHEAILKQSAAIMMGLKR